jgi:hypothetical protein
LFPTTAARGTTGAGYVGNFSCTSKAFNQALTPKPSPQRYTPSQEAETLVSLLTKAMELTKTAVLDHVIPERSATE